MSQTHDRPHDRRRLLPLPAMTGPEDRVLGLTAVALTAVLLLSIVRCSSAAVSTIDSELGASSGGRSTALTPIAGGEGAAGIIRPRPVLPVDRSRATADGATDTAPGDTTPLTFAAPPRQGTAADAEGEPQEPYGSRAPAERAGPTGAGPADGSRDPNTPAGAGVDLQGRLTQLTATTGGWFGPDSTQVAAEARPVLDEVAALLVQLPDSQVEVSGHTDTNGSAEANRRLSQARAEAVRDELVGRGVGADRLVAVGHGQSRPRNPNDTVAGRASNRRIELTVLG